MFMPKKNQTNEKDSVYFLKLVLYVILGSIWLKFASPLALGDSFMLKGLPVGFLAGLIFAAHDHFQVDRKIEYAILTVMTVVSLFLPVGIIV